MMWLLGTLALGLGAAWWLRRCLLVVTLSGSSMAPTYHDGDRVLVRRPVRRRHAAARLRVGQVVVADHTYPPHVTGLALAHTAPPGEGPGTRVVKRLAAVAGDPVPTGVGDGEPVVPPGQLVLIGDNPAGSLDSRHYGYVPADRVVGIAVRRLR